MSIIDEFSQPPFSRISLADEMGYYSLITWKDDYGSFEAFLGPNCVAEVLGDGDDHEEDAVVWLRSCFRGNDKHYSSWTFKGVAAAKRWVEEYIAGWVVESELRPPAVDYVPHAVSTLLTFGDLYPELSPSDSTERENGVTSRAKLLADIYGDDTAEISEMSAYLNAVRGASA